MGQQPRKPTIRGRRIIERPRLNYALEQSTARIRMLVGGSGYGKTVLLEQWAPLGGRLVGWFRVRPSATDVAAVARGLTSAVSTVVPGAGSRMLERLGITSDPEREAALLAEMLAEDLGAWPDNGLLVIDDYQRLVTSDASELFVETLVEGASIRVLLGTRVRPTWVRPRSILDGTVLEVPQSTLAMSADEADAVLDGAQVETLGLIALTGGWPAVVGLAAMVPDAGVDGSQSPDALYELFADEIYRGLDATLRTSLAILASMPLVDRELATTVLGAERGRRTCAVALELGLMDERDGRLELHPLAEAFFGRRGRKEATRDLRLASEHALNLYRERREWDPAFEVVRRFEIDAELPDLVLRAIDDTLNGGRLPVLREWIRYARGRRFRHPVVTLVEAELELRRGRHLTALTLGRGALETAQVPDEVRYRLMMTAGRAAHAGSRDEEALTLYRDALRVAPTPRQQRDARWGELVCTAALELPETHALLENLRTSVDTSDPRDLVRLADRQLSVGFRFGTVSHLADSRAAAELVDQIEDTFVRCSFRTVHGWALVLAVHYDEALVVAKTLIHEIAEHRVDLVIPYALAIEAAALRGLRRFDEALDSAELSSIESKRLCDDSGLVNAYALRVRALLEMGDVAEACATEPPSHVRTIQSSIAGEAVASRALALASMARISEARTLAEAAIRQTHGVEAAVLYDAVQAVCALNAREDDVLPRCEALMRRSLVRGAPDLVVTSYRANPGLLSVLLSSPLVRDETLFVVRRAHDERLLDELGTSTISILDPVSSLSAREQEVYALACEGLSNAAIGKQLFIAESTVKAHLHRLYEKLGVHSRTALLLHAKRRAHAAPAAPIRGTGSVSAGFFGSASDPNPDPRA